MLQIKIIVLLSMCHFGAYYILSRLTPYRQYLRRYLITSVIVVAVAALTKMVVLAYLAAIFLSLHFTRGKEPSVKLAFFFGVAFSMSRTPGVSLDIGLNLGKLSYQNILIMALLLPLVLFAKPERAMRRLNKVDLAVLMFFVWQLLINSRIDNVTEAFRTNLWLVIEYMVPYLAIRYYLKNYSLAFAAISFALFSQMFVSIVEGALSWKLYHELELIAGFADFQVTPYKFRNAFLRTEASLSNPLVLALFANISVLCAFIHYRKLGIDVPVTYRKHLALAALIVTLLGTFFTGSRAGLAGIALIVSMLIVLSWAINRPRDPKKILVTAAIFSLVIFFTVGNEFIKENFDYRYRLFIVSSDVIASNPVFGSQNVLSDPRMETMRQGEGIIDLVNTYLYFALYYGLPAVGLLVFSIFSGLSRTYDGLRYASGEMLTIGMFSFCSVLLMAFNILTTSPLGWTYFWIWLNLAICSNIFTRLDLERKAKAESQKRSS